MADAVNYTNDVPFPLSPDVNSLSCSKDTLEGMQNETRNAAVLTLLLSAMPRYALGDMIINQHASSAFHVPLLYLLSIPYMHAIAATSRVLLACHEATDIDAVIEKKSLFISREFIENNC